MIILWFVARADSLSKYYKLPVKSGRKILLDGILLKSVTR
jgi:hypothetical protein